MDSSERFRPPRFTTGTRTYFRLDLILRLRLCQKGFLATDANDNGMTRCGNPALNGLALERVFEGSHG